LIQSEAQKTERLAQLGLDLLVFETFSREMAAVEAADYMRRLKARFPSLKTVHVGENFRFGRGRTGDIQTLIATARAVGVHVVSIERVRFDGEPVSSTRIRGLLTEGRMEDVNTLLGYEYFCDGVCTPGNRIGRTIGFPTLNIPWTPPCRPRLGVYAVRVFAGVGEGPGHDAVANYGLRPTVADGDPLPRLEAHLLGSECPFGDGDAVHVRWLRFLREERRFGGFEELKTQIARDRVEALAYFYPPQF
jgi:riboflavin kinase/FMN adenylyltransferase